MKYSILMPYYKKPTLHNTLLSYQYLYKGRDDYEVIIIEDLKNRMDKREHNQLQSIIAQFAPDIRLRIVQMNGPDAFAPARHFNTGAQFAEGTYVVLTNPECVHIMDVLGAFDKELDKNPDAYIVAACFSTDSTGQVDRIADFHPKHKVWLQHSGILNRGLHWCSVMSMVQFKNVGGFDEGYAPGFGREDVDFIRTVREAGIKVVANDDIIVVHQDHPDFSPRKKELWARNKAYYSKKWRGK